MIDLGVVSSIYFVSGKTIVTVKEVVVDEKFQLNGAAICFNSMETFLIIGYKWWSDRGEVDLLFDDIKIVPEIGALVHIME